MSALALFAVTGTARAQAASPDETTASDGGEIVVIARGRTESLQSAPLSVTAFSSQALEDARIKGVSDFIGITPNISIVQSQSAGNSFITIRGISQVRNGESPIAVVTDGVQQISARQFTSDLFDVQQIEVLRGPQGALYGRNAIGGAIIITTKQPTNDFHVDAQISAGNGDDYRGQVSVSGPIIPDKLLFRIAGSARNFGGLLHNVYLGKTVDWVHDRNVRGQLKAFLTDTLTADLRGSYTHTKAIGDQYQYQGAKFESDTSCFLDPTNPFGGPAPDADRVTRSFCANNRGRNYRSIAEGSLKLTNEADWGTITNVFSYIHVKEYLEGDQFPYTASRNVFGTDGTQTQYENVRAWQDDFRIASPDGDRFRWMVGAYILRTKRFISTTTGLDNGGGITSIYSDPQYDDPINPTLSYLADRNRNTAYAFYGNVSYDLTERLEASVAFRYDHDHRRQEIDPRSSAGVPEGCTVTATDACSRVANFSKAQPKVTLKYQASDDLTLFADWGIGFRSGQFNQAGAAVAANLPGAFDLAKQESANTTEAGFKASLLGGRLRINGSAFYTADKNPFYFVFVGAVGAQILVNVDKVDLYGGEIEAMLTPIDGLDLFANYGYTHSKIKRFTFNPADVGNWAPYIPRDSGTIGAQYRFPVSDALNMFARGEMEHHGKQYWDPENATARSSFQLVNLHGGIEAEDGSWSLTGYVRNLTDKKYNAEFVSGGFVQPASPRTWGVELRTSF
ncbi:TonB-dependent receptor [Novosphingobium mangrovi (ex Huang et al. 2023)]|uniref:TonB-dependent receptor n=1 Tax=Novosphingobium mangrovi (ex Huang et al. 2023) TaxID=2976432 RepID=A0ABT2I1Y7_9SPHN|nr:TonB-dependent receptor [Novosphingobium mangrovi (ex Huang et al. 2023)]MCT2398808.1 TonB-dependent receptor [Novosphingobium mangrovi (ex Huang et al. 2023)]